MRDDNPETKRWRTGILKNLRQHLKDETQLQMIENLLYVTRCATRTIFHVLWKMAVDHLAVKQEVGAVDQLVKYYLETSTDKLFEAPWRCSADKIIPSTIAATQAQESWHVHRLRANLGKKEQSFQQLLENLRRHWHSRTLQVEKAPHINCVPATSWRADLVRGPCEFTVLNVVCLAWFVFGY